MKRICIHQPDFVPWLGFFHRLLLCDTYVVLDDVQFLRRGWHHRDKIKTRQGEAWLSLSIARDDYHQLISQIELSPGLGWIDDHLNLLKENYQFAPCFNKFFPSIEKIYRSGFRKMMEFNMTFLRFFFELFGVRAEIIFSSKLNVPGKSSEKLLNLVNAVGGTRYLSGTGAKAYLDESIFQKAGIPVQWQVFQHPVYPQLHGDFIPGLSCLDILFNCGAESRKVLESCLKPR